MIGKPHRHECSHASANIETRRQSDGATSGTTPYIKYNSTLQYTHDTLLIPLACELKRESESVQLRMLRGNVV